MTNRCALCKKETDSENAAVLAFTSYATPKYLCEECENDIEKATRSMNIDEIESSIERVAEKLKQSDTDDRLVIQTVSDILNDSKDRLELIKSGDYTEEADEDEFFEVPQELLESEEDKQLAKEQEEKDKTFDKYYNIGMIIAFAAFGAYLIYRIVKYFL